MPSTRPVPVVSFLRRSAAAAAITLGCTGALAAPMSLNPTMAGDFAIGTGVNASFYAIDDAWRGSSVYWNESSQTYSNAAAPGYSLVSDQAWGTGLWGLQDWSTVQANAAGLAALQWHGTVAAINHGDVGYLTDPYGATRWGVAELAPLFDAGSGSQNNWTAHYSGYLRIAEAGAYNFGVLYDDGFFLRIWGADDQSVLLYSDFLSSRDRLGFDHDLLLGTGLYRFELGAYDRLEVGIVNLAWQREGRWETVPTSALVSTPEPVALAQVSLPGTATLLALGLFSAGAIRRKPD